MLEGMIIDHTLMIGYVMFIILLSFLLKHYIQEWQHKRLIGKLSTLLFI